MRFALRILILLVIAAAVQLGAAELKISKHKFERIGGDPVDAELGELRVPENRSNAKSRTITLRFVRFKSTSAKPGSPIVYLAGGPGGSGIDSAQGSRFPIFMALREFGDVIALDQRGVGDSDPDLDCNSTFAVDPSKPLEAALAGKAMSEAAARCFADWRKKGVDLGAYNTLESAHDLSDLAKALGAPKISLVGISYGTHLALAMAKYHGAQIDRMILLGLEPLDSTEKLPSDQQAMLEEIAKFDEAKNLLPTIDRLAKSLDEKPRVITLVHPFTRQPVSLTLGGNDLRFIVAMSLTGPETFAGLPDVISRIDQGDWTALGLASGRFRFGPVPSAMSIAMDCASGATKERRARIAEEAKTTIIRDVINIPYPEICQNLGIPDLGDDFRAPVKSDIPTLLISGTLDGRTSVRAGDEVARGLSSSVHLVIDGAGHSDPLFLASPKILEAMQQFLRGEKVTITRATAARPQFIPPRRVVTLSDEQLQQFVGEYQAGGKSVRNIMKIGPLLYSRRDQNEPFPLRPMSENEFFFEGSPALLRFVKDAEGKVVSCDFVGADGKALAGAKIR